MGRTGRNGVRATALALAFSALGGCMLDPLYAVYAVAGVGDDDSSSAAADAPSAAAATPNVAMGTSEASLNQMILRENAARWLKQDCAVMQLNHLTAVSNIANTAPSVNLYGRSMDNAIRKAWSEKGCSPSYAPSSRIGATIQSVDPQLAGIYGRPTSGMVIQSVSPGGAAQKAGLIPQDIVVAVNGQPVVEDNDYLAVLLASPAGSALNLKLWRDGVYRDVSVVPSVVVPPPSALPVSSTPMAKTAPASSSTSLQGMSLGAVTSSYAQAAGLPAARGAWVIDTIKGSAADVAGIKPLDVIVEVAGQEIDSAADLVAISGRMRAGYKTSISLLREQKRHEVQMVLKNE